MTRARYRSVQGDCFDQLRVESVAHAVVCSLWRAVQALGIPCLFVLAGVMNRKVCALTKESALLYGLTPAF